MAKDPDGDKIQFLLDHRKPGPTLGSAIITPEGLITYKPCANCNGQDLIYIAGQRI